MKITHKELNDFWNEALSDDFYVHEGIPDWTGEEPPDSLITVEDYATLGWQGFSDMTPTPFMQALRNRDPNCDLYSIPTLIKAWRENQSHAYLSVKVPTEHLDALNAFLETLPGVETPSSKP